jgi:hypothetical protein
MRSDAHEPTPGTNLFDYAPKHFRTESMSENPTRFVDDTEDRSDVDVSG